jgi:quercetin dioxygenase-like cupin family protein
VVELSTEELQLTVKNFESPDGYREMPKSKMTYVDFGPYRVIRLEFEPGWKWSKNMKPEVQTDWCETLHLVYILSGRHRAKMKDGTETEYGPGDLVLIPPGHDGWTVGDEPAVMLDLGPLLIAEPFVP